MVTLAVNFGLYVAAFRFLTATTIPTRSLWLGAAVGAVFLDDPLSSSAAIYVSHVVSHASNTYGTFATVIGLLVLASPGRADDAVRGRDQRGRGAPAVAAQPARAARRTRRPGDAARAGQGRGAPRRASRSTCPSSTRPASLAGSEQPVRRLAPGHLERPRAQPALGRTPVAHRAVRRVGDREVAAQHTAGERRELVARARATSLAGEDGDRGPLRALEERVDDLDLGSPPARSAASA